MNVSFVQQRTVPALTRRAIACPIDPAPMATMTWFMENRLFGL
jgi:hypothetical protein